MLSFGSVCSGIEAASVAWDVLGWKAAWLAEIDKAACEVLAYRFPDVPNHGDMLTLAAKVRAREIAAPDILVGGTPCQSFSVAGMRKGLDDPRGQLTIAFIDLANAIDEIRAADGLPPVIIIWENVPGVLNHKDNPLGCFLAGLVGEDDALVPAGKRWTNAGAVFGPQRAIAWRVLDAQYFGLAQRRRRVFVVASARERFDPAAVLLEFDGVRRDSPPSREAGEGVAGTLDARTTGGGFPGSDGACSGHVVPAERPGGGHAGLNEPVPTWWDGRDVSQTLDAVLHKGQTMPEKNRFPAVLQPVVSVALRGREGGGTAELGDDVAGCLRASTGGGDKPHVLAPVEGFATSGDGYWREGVGPLRVRAQDSHENVVCVTGAVTHTLKAEGFDASEDGTGRGQPIVPATREYPFQYGDYRDPLPGESPNDYWGRMTDYEEAHGINPTAATLYSIMPMNSGKDFVAREVPVAQPLMAAGPVGGNQGGDYLLEHVHMAVRRLMPVECERLQGFPDNWTLVPTGKTRKPAADGPRYKQCGNSMATKVMRWIGMRVHAHLIAIQPGHNGGPPLDDFDYMLGAEPDACDAVLG